MHFLQINALETCSHIALTVKGGRGRDIGSIYAGGILPFCNHIVSPYCILLQSVVRSCLVLQMLKGMCTFAQKRPSNRVQDVTAWFHLFPVYAWAQTGHPFHHQCSRFARSVLINYWVLVSAAKLHVNIYVFMHADACSNHVCMDSSPKDFTMLSLPVQVTLLENLEPERIDHCTSSTHSPRPIQPHVDMAVWIRKLCRDIYPYWDEELDFADCICKGHAHRDSTLPIYLGSWTPARIRSQHYLESYCDL